MPKVLRIINRFNLGGPTFNAAYLTRYLPPEFETLLIGGQKDESEASSYFIPDQLGLKPTILQEMKREVGFINDYRSYKKIKEIIGDFKPDIVHTHASKAGAVGRLAAIKMKVPVIVHTFHGNVFKGYFGPVKTGIYKKMERYLAHRSSAIIAISDLQKKELVEEHRICGDEKIHVIPLGFDLSRFRENTGFKRTLFRKKYNVPDDTIAIAIVGRLVPIKNHFLFLEVIKLLAGTSIPFRAFVVGDGEMKQQLVDYCRQNQISFTLDGEKESGQVVFTSWIHEIDEVNAGADIIALTSDNEGTPVSLIEAQASGKPIVSTNVGGIENIVIPGQTALLSPPGNTGLLFENIQRLALEPNTRKAFGEKGWSFVEERFHYSRLVKDMTNLYYSLLKT